MISQQRYTYENLHIILFINVKDKMYQKIKEVLTVFASTTIFHSHNKAVFIVRELSRNSLYVPLILDQIKQLTSDFTYFFVENEYRHHLPLADLYDYQTQKWYLS